MKMFSRVAIAMAGMTGLAAAQPKADSKPPAADPKPGDPKAGGMDDMKPPADLAAMAKAVSGTWSCKGKGADHTMKMSDMTGTLKMRLEVDGWWMHSSFESKIGKESFHFESYTTLDPSTKKWRRVMVETGGIWSSGESAGMKDKKVDWEMTVHTPMGDAMFRDHEDVSDPKAGAKMKGELSMDMGKTWNPVYEMSCKK